jgi:DNA-binding GntR family transcriptional regulator
MPRTNSLAAQIAAQILDHIRARDLSRGQHLPSQALADACRVSRAPVSSALKFLENLGVVRAERNRGYFLARDAQDLADLNLRTGGDDAEDRFYFEIAEDRLSGKLPDQVTENELMRRYKMPRGRLLKTLHKMAQEGWVERLLGHGWEFRPALTSRASYEAGYRFRAALEAAAVLEPSFTVDTEAFAEARRQQRALLDGGYRKLSRAQLFRINSEFHEMIVACAGNEFFLDAVKRVNRLRRLMEYRVTLDRSRLPQQCREHLKILDLLEAGDFATASTQLRKHIDGARAVKSPDVDRRPSA